MSDSINPSDDYPHTPEKELEWRESYYFNFVSHDNKASGFTTIGISPNQERTEFILVFFFGDKRITYFKEHEVLTDSKFRNGLSDNALSYKLMKPMKRWNIDFASENLDLKIQWNARFPAFDFGKGSGTSWKNHFEQSGIVKGEARLPDGIKLRIIGYSQRDKSWGPRNWHIQKWFALHAQFKAYAVGLRRDTVNSIPYVSGGLFSDEAQMPVSNVDLEISHDRSSHIDPSGSLTTIEYADGKVMTLRSRLVSPTTYLRFSRSFPSGSTELVEGMAIHENVATKEKGTGLIEFLSTQLNP